MQWRGLDRRTGSHDLQDGSSPDTINAGHFEGKTGELGPRAGVTFVNPQAYVERICGIIPFNLPNADGILLPALDGTISASTLSADPPGEPYIFGFDNAEALDLDPLFDLEFEDFSVGAGDDLTMVSDFESAASADLDASTLFVSRGLQIQASSADSGILTLELLAVIDGSTIAIGGFQYTTAGAPSGNINMGDLAWLHSGSGTLTGGGLRGRAQLTSGTTLDFRVEIGDVA